MDQTYFSALPRKIWDILETKSTTWSGFKKLRELHKEWTEAGVSIASRASRHRRSQETGYNCHIVNIKLLLN